MIENKNNLFHSFGVNSKQQNSKNRRSELSTRLYSPKVRLGIRQWFSTETEILTGKIMSPHITNDDRAVYLLGRRRGDGLYGSVWGHRERHVDGAWLHAWNGESGSSRLGGPRCRLPDVSLGRSSFLSRHRSLMSCCQAGEIQLLGHGPGRW
ncbi:hypothetical protein CDAR_376111 [Caerostris darwini]|uniref:Uncharacterized protein n=1 Tax=Caerostris darwini TaxID=1538125 RepID=A0AAV4VG91_9ARAC|nr:hypothetical protein CDAR_376111 [Caerostris darwini]